MIADNLKQIRKRMAAACARAGRNEGDVQLVAVTKKMAPEAVTEAFECGIAVMGENRIQEAKQKIPMCPGAIEWHMIGHLQTNKVKDAVRLFSMIHSVDSQRLLETVNAGCVEAGVNMPVCLEVNVSGERSKFGISPDDLEDVVKAGAACMNVDIVGLMTMPPFTEDPEGARPYFRELRELRDQVKEATGFELPELSMGMSNDFEVAIEEGATFARIGTSIFGSRT